MAFDGIVTKSIASELQNLSGARIDKIFQPNKNDIVLGFYLDGINYALNICIDSQNCRLNLTTHSKPNPKVAPNFCMLLRKYLLGLRIKNVITSNLERLVIIEFEGLDDIDDLITKKLIIELMGRHSNIILLDDNNTILDSLRHTRNELDSFRNIIPHVKYVFPTTEKQNFLHVKNFEDFYSKLNCSILNKLTIENLPKIISNTFNGICKSFIEAIIYTLEIDSLDKHSIEKIYNYIMNVINNIDSNNLKFEYYEKDYFLCTSNENDEPFNLNFFIDDFYYKKETSEQFKSYRDSVLKLILGKLKKYNTRLSHINEKLKDCENMDTYKLYGELITANLYKIPNHNLESIEVENYYDNNNLVTIPLDKKYLPSINAKKYFKKYNKLKNTLEIVTVQKKDTLNELDYIESIVYELQKSETIEDVSDIYEEISENIIFKETNQQSKKSYKLKKSKLTKNKTVSFNPIKYKIDNYTVLVGRNNKENDYLTLKYAKKTDIWFHTKDIHGSHVILQLDGLPMPNYDILIKCAQIAAYHSKASSSSNVPVDFCEVKYVKKPSGSKPGMVIFTNNETLNVNPYDFKMSH